ncbi:hypothetical protein FA95DRAFT_1521221 [Auriscalpium vulgare]|uniref:Uncharacterized protein n=1 Tax=Auriscalpium vulgare TaxID=40419 RepID=A0ACB8RP45_9AGAM|nr:hypothetical protein FA95DRAFT_1521221 [Auriscalpium vulgare]
MKYEHSKVAKVLGLQSLGMETLASLRWIIGKDPQYKLAREYGLLPRNDDSNFMITIAAISCYEGKQDQLHMLSYRIAAISDLIRWRRRWWKVLAADMRRQSEAQPVLFYGTLLAVFFGVMSVVQTVTAVWALVLAIQQAGGGNSS